MQLIKEDRLQKDCPEGNTSHKTDLLCAGELLVDFTPAGLSGGGRTLYEQNPGGAPANVAAAAARLGLESGFIGKVGADAFGYFLRSELISRSVRTEGLKFDAAATTLAFVHLAESGERGFSFYRNPGADTRLSHEDIDFDMLSRCRALHFGALLFTAEPARSAMRLILEFAREKGKLISYDPNWRPALWSSPDEGLLETKKGLRYADIVKVSGEELSLLTGASDPGEGVDVLLTGGARLVLVTLGAAGVIAATGRYTQALQAYRVKAVDTTGCGDAAMAGCLFELLHLGKQPEDLTPGELRRVAAFSNACGALCATRRGGMPAMPALFEVKALIGEDDR